MNTTIIVNVKSRKSTDARNCTILRPVFNIGWGVDPTNSLITR